MRPALASRPPVDFTRPDTVVTVTIDPATGYPANALCPEKREEFFIAGTQPTTGCPQHGGEPLQQMQPVPNPEPLPDVAGEPAVVTP